MKIKLLTIAIVTLAFLVSCDKHDGMDDSVIVGPMAPQVYWELGSSTAKAGGDVDFKVQYYTSNEEAQIDHLEVWYNVVITETRQVSCPLLSTFSYTISKTIEEEIRIAQLISSHEHKEEYWNDTHLAYVIEDGFPTSSTLNSVSWVEPDTYDDKKMKTYFGENFTQQFKDSLFYLMSYQDFNTMMSSLALVEDFTIYEYQTYDANSDSYISHFKLDTISSIDFENKEPARNWHKYGETEDGRIILETIPDDMISIYDGLTMEQLLFNSGKNIYDIQFNRAYYINANIRCIDDKGAVGLATETKVELN